MPAIAAGTTEVIFINWIIAEGSKFSTTDEYAVIETEKATVELEAEIDGVLLRQLVAPGTSVKVGAPIAVIAAADEEVPDVDLAMAELGLTSAPLSQNTVDAEPPTAVPTPETSAVKRRFASPLARKLAHESGVNLAAVQSTGPSGRIVRRDVEATIALRAGATASTPAPATSAVLTPSGMHQATPHSSIRRTIARRLTESKQQVPHFYLRASAKVDRLLALRDELRAGDSGIKLSLNDFIVRAAGHAHRLVPEMNVTWTDEAVLKHDTVDVSIAVASERGLFTPVVRNVINRSFFEVTRDTRQLIERVGKGTLTQNELEGGSIAVSNLGMYDVDEFFAIINPPQSSILAVGGVRDEVVVLDGAPAVAPVLRYTLSVDHRPLDGVIAARWMKEFTKLLETPTRILL